MIEDVWRKRLHGRKNFWKLPHVQAVLHLNLLHSLDVQLRRAVNLFFYVNVRLFTRHLSSIQQDHLRHRSCHGAFTYFAYYIPSMLWEVLTKLSDRECLSAGFHSQSLMLRNPFQYVLHQRSILPLLLHQKIKLRFPFIRLVRALYLRKPWNVSHHSRSIRMCPVIFSSCIMVVVFNRLRDNQPLLPEMNSLLYTVCMILPLTLLVLLIVAKGSGLDQRLLLHLKRLDLPYFNTFLFPWLETSLFLVKYCSNFHREKSWSKELKKWLRPQGFMNNLARF